MCVNFCVGGLHLPIQCADERKPVVLYFDRNEKFMHTVRRVWDRWKKKQGTKFRQIATIENVDSEYYPLQAADLLAWIANRQRPHGQDQIVDVLKMAAILMIKHPSLYYDLDKILEHYPDGTLKPGPKE